MTITLNNVSSLLHIPIVSQFFTYITLEYMRALSLMVELLGVNKSDANAEMRKCQGAHIRLSWL